MSLENVKRFLPDVVLELIDLIGYPATEDLVKRLGGITFPIVKAMRLSGCDRLQLLIDSVGKDNADKIIHRFGGEELYIPKCDKAFIKLRNQQFLEEVSMKLHNGVSLQWAFIELCPKYGITERLGYQLRKQMSTGWGEQNQQSLF